MHILAKLQKELKLFEYACELGIVREENKPAVKQIIEDTKIQIERFTKIQNRNLI